MAVNTVRATASEAACPAMSTPMTTRSMKSPKSDQGFVSRFGLPRRLAMYAANAARHWLAVGITQPVPSSPTVRPRIVTAMRGEGRR